MTMRHRSISTARIAAALAAVPLLFGAAIGPAAAAPKCTAAQGQALIDQGRYQDAIRKFTCLIEAEPTGVEGYRGRIEAELLLGRYSDALRDWVHVTGYVLPVDPGAVGAVVAGYLDRLDADPNDVPALTGLAFARWYDFDYAQAIHVLNRLLAVRPADPYAMLFRGSSRLLRGATPAQGAADLERAIELEPESADVRFIVADAYTYGQPDPARAFLEASLALAWGLDTPRVHAILAAAYLAFGDPAAAAVHIERHIELVTTELLAAPPLVAGGSLALDMVAGRTYEIPLPVIAGETIAVAVASQTIWDSILLLRAPDGSPVLGSDDDKAYHAGFEWVAAATGTYSLRVTSFEAAGAGVLVVTRD
jgi:tetratricopeptide (TPR) repeat protein